MKTQDLIGSALDWAVAKCEGTLGQKPNRCFDCKYYEERQGRDDAIQYCHHPKMDFEDGSGALRVWPSDYETHEQCPITSLTAEPFSTDWNLAGPIIEQEITKIFRNVGGTWSAMILKDVPIPPEDRGTSLALTQRMQWNGSGPTPLIAAMRAYVRAKHGDEINIPEELK